jgi:hypothetical protein
MIWRKRLLKRLPGVIKRAAYRETLALYLAVLGAFRDGLIKRRCSVLFYEESAFELQPEPPK